MRLIYKCLFVILITSDLFSPLFECIRFYDEILALVAVLLLVKYKYKRLLYYDKRILFLLGCLLFIGICSTVKYHYQPAFGAVWRDFLAVSKFPLCYCLFQLNLSLHSKEKLREYAVALSKFFVVLLVCVGLVNLVIYVPELSNGKRYGIPLFSFLYSHNTYLVAAAMVMLAVFFADGFKRHRIYIFLCCIVMLLTFRSKVFPILGLMSIIFFLDRKHYHFKLKTIFIFLIFAVFTALYLSAERIDEYVYYGENTARGAFYINGVLIASDCFPLGSGFGTFASSLSGEYYSPLYSLYHMDHVIGITEEDISYAGDTFLPYVYAQYGYIGLIIYVAMIIAVFQSVHNRFRYLSDKWIAAMLLLVYSVSASMAESFFTNDSAVVFSLVLALYLGADENNQISNSIPIKKKK